MVPNHTGSLVPATVQGRRKHGRAHRWRCQQRVGRAEGAHQCAPRRSPPMAAGRPLVQHVRRLRASAHDAHGSVLVGYSS